MNCGILEMRPRTGERPIQFIVFRPHAMSAYRRAKCAAIAVSLILAAACSGSQPKGQGPGDVIATVGTTPVTLAQVDRRAMREPATSFGDAPLEQAIYDARRAAVAEIVGDILIDQESRRLNVERATLYEKEVTSKVKPVTDQDVAAWYDANANRVQGASRDQVRSSILSLLTQMRMQDARDAYLGTLKSRTPVKVTLEPPRASVTAGDSPARGPANAPIELIEFADFQCPYCQAATPTVKRVLEQYGDRVRFVYRNYPLPSHPHAIPAAEAAQCANEQGQFWPYHDKLFSKP